jgi:hypothetical protein
VSAGPDPHVDNQTIERERVRLGRRLEEVARLCEANVPPATFYGELLKRLLESLAAPAGVVWVRTAQGNLQLQFQVNLKEVGLDRSEEARQSHEELLRQAVLQPRPLHLPPHSGVGAAAEGRVAAGNPTDFLLLIVPILMGDQVAGLIEVWQAANRPAQAVPGWLQFMGLMAELGARYQRNQMVGQMAGQQQLWVQLEAFARQIHSSLSPVEVSYLVANEGRRLVECDRVSVAVRQARKARIEAVSGADVVERRSSLVQRMRTLCDRVLDWGEKLVFNGTRDEGLPPLVLKALDDYLSVSSSKLLVVQPLRDERQKDKQPARAALLMECFEPPTDPQQYIARLDVIARHATSAVYNAVEHRRIPMRYIWQPLAKVQEGVGGKAQAISLSIVTALSLIGAALWFVPYPLKMDSTGKLLPEVRRVVYPPNTGIVREFRVHPGEVVHADRCLAVLHDLKLEETLLHLETERDSARREEEEANKVLNGGARAIPANDLLNFQTTAALKHTLWESKDREIAAHIRRTNGLPLQPGFFELRAPTFTAEEARRVTRTEWTVLNANFRDEWEHREAKPSDPLIRLGAKEGPWEIELKIPQKHLGQIMDAYVQLGMDKPLDVDFILRSDPNHTYRGKLYRHKIASEANPVRDDNNEAEPEAVAYVSLDDEGIDPSYRLPRESLTSGTEVHAKVRCGDHRLGYSLFYGVWEFFYEKVVFFF